MFGVQSGLLQILNCAGKVPMDQHRHRLYIQFMAQPLSKVGGKNVIITVVTYKLNALLFSIPVETPKGTGTVP